MKNNLRARTERAMHALMGVSISAGFALEAAAQKLPNTREERLLRASSLALAEAIQSCQQVEGELRLGREQEYPVFNPSIHSLTEADGSCPI